MIFSSQRIGIVTLSRPRTPGYTFPRGMHGLILTLAFTLTLPLNMNLASLKSRIHKNFLTNDSRFDQSCDGWFDWDAYELAAMESIPDLFALKVAIEVQNAWLGVWRVLGGRSRAHYLIICIILSNLLFYLQGFRN